MKNETRQVEKFCKYIPQLIDNITSCSNNILEIYATTFQPSPALAILKYIGPSCFKSKFSSSNLVP
jgi:uncharacterized protein (UPF0333 family)